MGNSFSITNLSNNTYHEIIPNLYIGDKDSIKQTFFANKRKMVIINATKDVPISKIMPFTVQNYRIPVNDDLKRSSIIQMATYLPNTASIIDRHLKNGYTVLVHCYAGRQRSCAIVAAYLMKYKHYRLKEAINYIKKKRPYSFFPYVNFYYSLRLFQQN